jgi:hypothetical protein
MDKILEDMDGVQLEIWAVSCVPNKKICQDKGVKGFPTVLLFPAKDVNGTKINIGALHAANVLKGLGLSQESYGGKQQKSNTQKSKANNNNNNKKDASPAANYFTARSKQETYEDAHRSLVFALRNSIYASNDALSSTRRSTFKEFLQLLQKTAPGSASFQPLLKVLLKDFNKIASTDVELNRILDENPLPTTTTTTTTTTSSSDTTTWSPACMQHGSGYTCGLWQLFHIITIGLVEWNVLSSMEESQMVVPHQAAETIRNFVAEFFQCEECKVHFLNEYDSCGHDRCNRLPHDNTDKDKSDWIQFPLWFYETHNGVNARLREERMERHEESPVTTPQDVLWPPMEACPKCWLSEGRWDEEAVYSYLRLEYWCVCLCVCVWKFRGEASFSFCVCFVF